MKKTFTLTELLLAISLLAVIILAAYAFNTTSSMFLRSSDVKTEVLNEATRIMEHISKNALCAHGNLASPGIVLEGTTVLNIQQDVFGCSVSSTVIPSPENYADDVVVRYEFGGSGNPNEVRFYPNYRADPGNSEVLSRKLKEATLTIVNDAPPAPPNTISIQSKFVKNPSLAEDPRNNPIVELETKVYGYGISQK